MWTDPFAVNASVWLWMKAFLPFNMFEIRLKIKAFAINMLKVVSSDTTSYVILLKSLASSNPPISYQLPYYLILVPDFRLAK